MIDSIFDKVIDILVFQEILYTIEQQVNPDIKDNIIKQSNISHQTYFVQDEKYINKLDINDVQLTILKVLKDKSFHIKIMNDFINYIDLKDENSKIVLNHENHLINESEIILYKFSGNITTEKNLFFNDFYNLDITINVCVLNYWNFIENYKKFIKI